MCYTYFNKSVRLLGNCFHIFIDCNYTWFSSFHQILQFCQVGVVKWKSSAASDYSTLPHLARRAYIRIGLWRASTLNNNNNLWMSCESRQTCYATGRVIPCSRICHLCFPFMHNFKQDLLEFAVGEHWSLLFTMKSNFKCLQWFTDRQVPTIQTVKDSSCNSYQSIRRKTKRQQTEFVCLWSTAQVLLPPSPCPFDLAALQIFLHSHARLWACSPTPSASGWYAP